jgi:hypothetical protein
MKRLLGEALAPRGRIGLVTGFGLLVISVGAVLLPLLDYWFSGRTHPNAIGGLLPWNDAAGYYGCALSLLDGEGYRRSASVVRPIRFIWRGCSGLGVPSCNSRSCCRG